MTDEEKKVEVCKCGEIGKFFTLVAAIFLGVLLAILVSAALLKPNCPCSKGFPKGGPMMERQIPPGFHHMHRGFHELNENKIHDKSFKQRHKQDIKPDEDFE